MKHLFTKLLSAMLIASLLLTPIAAVAEDMGEVVIAAAAESEAAAPADEGEAAPAEEGEAAPTDAGEAAPANEGDTDPADEGDAADEGASGEDGEDSEEVFEVLGDVDSCVEEAEMAELPDEASDFEAESEPFAGGEEDAALTGMLLEGGPTATLQENVNSDWGEITVKVGGEEIQKGEYGDQYTIPVNATVEVTFTPLNGGTLDMNNTRIVNSQSWATVTDFGYVEGRTSSDPQTLSFIMGEGSYHIWSQFFPPANNVELSYDFDGGEASFTVDGATSDTAETGQTITVTATPAEGYCLMSGGIYVTPVNSGDHYADFEKDGNNTYTHSDGAQVFSYTKSDFAETVYVVFVPIQTYTVTLKDETGETVLKTYSSDQNPEQFGKRDGRIAFIFPEIGDVFPDAQSGEVAEYYFNTGDTYPLDSGELVDLWGTDYTFYAKKGMAKYHVMTSYYGGGVGTQPPQVSYLVDGNIAYSEIPMGKTVIISLTNITPKTEITGVKVNINLADEQYGPPVPGDPVNVTKVDNSTYSFTMPQGNVVVEVRFAVKGDYAITLLPCEHGTIAMKMYGTAVNSADAGAYLWWDAKPDPDYGLESVTIDDGTSAQTYVYGEGPSEIVMPAHDITVSAKFVFVGGAHKINFDAFAHGMVTALRDWMYTVTSANAGDFVGLSINPEMGYRPGEIKVMYNGNNIVERDGDEAYGFIMPNGEVTVSATFIKGSYEITTIDPENAEISVNIDHYSVASADKGEKVVLYTYQYNYDDYKQNRPYPYTVKQGETNVEVKYDTDGAYFIMPDGPVTVSVEFIGTSTGNLITLTDFQHAWVGATVSGYSYEVEGYEPYAMPGETVVIGYDEIDEGIQIGSFSVTCNGQSVSYTRGSHGEGWETFLFTMPDGPVTVTATAVSSGEATAFNLYQAVDGNNGTINAPETAVNGETVEFTLTPNAGYAEKANSVYVTFGQGNRIIPEKVNGKYVFEMPRDNATIHAAFIQQASFTTAPAAKEDLVYTGAAQALIEAGVPEGGVVKYRQLDTEPWSDQIPTATHAGVYDVYYMIEGDADHASVEFAEPIVVEIARAKATAVFEDKIKTYGDADPAPEYVVQGLLGSDTLSGEPDRAPGENVKLYAYSLINQDNADYEVTSTGALTIVPKMVELRWAETDFTYNGEAQIPTATVTNAVGNDECNVIVDAEEGDDATDAGVHTAVAVSLSNYNYTLPEQAACMNEYTIAKAVHADVPDAMTVTVSALGAEGVADLSRCIPEDVVEWAVVNKDDLISVADEGPNRTLNYGTVAADAGTRGVVQIQVETKNYSAYKVDVAFVTSDSDVFTLTFDTKGGEPIDSIKLKTGDAYGELPVPVREAYAFNRWLNGEGSHVDSNTTMGAGDTTIYAEWLPIAYKITLNLNGHGAIPAADAEDYPDNTRLYTIESGSFALPKLADVTEEGKTYTFSGWSLEGQEDAYTDVIVDPTVLLADQTYTANWVEGTMVGQVDYTAPEPFISLIQGILDMIGNMARTDVNAGQEVGSTRLAEDLKQIAAVNSALIETGATNKTVSVGMDISADGISDSEKEGILLSFEPSTDAGNEVITDFIDIKLTQSASYISAGGAEVSGEPRLLTDLPMVLEIPITYNLTGRYHLRLYRRHNGKTEELVRIPSRTSAIDKRQDGTFYVHNAGVNSVIYIYSKQFSVFAMASDSVESFEVSFESNGGSSVATQRVYKGEKVAVPAAPSRASTATIAYHFDQWCTDPQLNNVYDFNTAVTAGFTLYARWKETPIATQAAQTPAAPTVSAPAAPAEPPITITKAPASFKAKAQKKGKVALTWKKIKKTKKTKAILAKIKGIEVQYSTDPSFATNTITRNLGKNKVKLNLKLEKNTVYYFRARYTDGAGGVSKWSVTRKVKTKKK